jgi:hypothetical protein
MCKKLFLALPVVFLFSFLFIQISEAVQYEYTFDKIGFWSETVELPSQEISYTGTLPVKFDDDNPAIYGPVVYTGPIPNGDFLGIGFHIVSTNNPNDPIPEGGTWGTVGGFNDVENPQTININDSSRKKFVYDSREEKYYSLITVTDL